MEYIWLVVLACCLIAEALTADLVVIWFFPAALVSMVAAFCGAPWYVQLLLFLAVGLILLFSTRPVCKKWLKSKKVRTNVDALIGETALVTEEIANINQTGEVKLNGLRWSARAEDPARIIPVGTEVTVLEVKGVKLIVR